MKAAVLTGLRRMEVRQVPDPKIEKDTDVLLKIEKVGVCGSDVHYFETGRIGSQVVTYPFIVGHECRDRGGRGQGRQAREGGRAGGCRARRAVCTTAINAIGDGEHVLQPAFLWYPRAGGRLPLRVPRHARGVPAACRPRASSRPSRRSSVRAADHRLLCGPTSQAAACGRYRYSGGRSHRPELHGLREDRRRPGTVT